MNPTAYPSDVRALHCMEVWGGNEAVESAVGACVRERAGTADVGGSLTTSEAGNAVRDRLRFEQRSTGKAPAGTIHDKESVKNA